MKAYVITITSFPESVALANRCISSGNQFNVDVKIFSAITPKDSPVAIMVNENLYIDNFVNNKYSRFNNLISCFLSHYFLWKKCINFNESIIILEHDAVFVSSVDYDSLKFDKILNIGKPSFGSFKIKDNPGIYPLFSKPYFPGAHGYIIKPEGAKLLIDNAKWHGPHPTDVFLDISRFPWLQEYYPWPVEVNETFSTVQLKTGSLAKHAFDSNYKCIEII